MHCYQPMTNHIEDAECEWFQENQSPSFPDVLNIRNNNEDSSIEKHSNSIVNNNVISAALNQEVTTITEHADCVEVSPKRAKL